MRKPNKTYESEYENPDLYVTVKCTKCGNVGCFYPHRVAFLECKCGNTNYGNSTYDWPKGLFGDHKFVHAQIWRLPSMWELAEQAVNERHKAQHRELRREKIRAWFRTLWHTASSPVGIASAVVVALLTELFYFSFGITAGILTFIIGYAIVVIMLWHDYSNKEGAK